MVATLIGFWIWGIGYRKRSARETEHQRVRVSRRFQVLFCKLRAVRIEFVHGLLKHLGHSEFRCFKVWSR